MQGKPKVLRPYERYKPSIPAHAGEKDGLWRDCCKAAFNPCACRGNGHEARESGQIELQALRVQG